MRKRRKKESTPSTIRLMENKLAGGWAGLERVVRSVVSGEWCVVRGFATVGSVDIAALYQQRRQLELALLQRHVQWRLFGGKGTMKMIIIEMEIEAKVSKSMSYERRYSD